MEEMQSIRFKKDEDLIKQSASEIADECIRTDNVIALRGAIANITDDDVKLHLLSQAVRCQKYECVKAMLDHGVNAYGNLGTYNIKYPLYQAVLNNDVKALRILTRDLRSNSQLTGEEQTLNESNAAESNLILSGGSILGSKVEALGGALLHAVSYNMISCVEFFIDLGVNASKVYRHEDEPVRWFTPLIAACCITSTVSETACMDICSKNPVSVRLDIVRMLLDKGHADVNVKVYDGTTAITHAARSGVVECVRLLIDSGADVNAVGRNGRSPLMQAIFAKTTTVEETCRLLIEAGADVNIFDAGGIAALDAAIDTGNIALVELLLSSGAITDTTNPKYNPNIDRRTNPTDAPLFAATTLGNLNLVRLLLQWGVDVNHAPPPATSKRSGGLILTRIGVRHSQASTPFRYSLEVGNYQLARLLLAAGLCRTRARQTVESLLMELCSGLFYSMLSLDVRLKQKALEELHEEICKVQSLKEFCRLSVRRSIRDMKNLDRLPLPSSMISYLWMNDI